MRRLCSLLIISLSLMLFAGSAMAFTLSTDFTGVSITNADLTSSTLGQWNDLVRWQINNAGGNTGAWAQQTPRPDLGPEGSLLMYGFDAGSLNPGCDWTLEFDFINQYRSSTSPLNYSDTGTVYLGGLTGAQMIDNNAPWNVLSTTFFYSAPLANNTNDWTHVSLSGTVLGDFDILYLAFKMGGAGEALRGIDNVNWNVCAAPVPEPSTLLLLGAGLAGLAGMGWRRRKNG